MIFVTTGTQLPFPRLIAAMDALAPALGERIVAQVGQDAAPRTHLEYISNLSPTAYDEIFAAARVVVAHAGIGTLLSAKTHRKPLVIVPRRHALGEHRNDHQLATARRLDGVRGVHIAWEVAEIEPLLRAPDLAAAGPEPGPEAERLLAHVKAFIDAAR